MHFKCVISFICRQKIWIENCDLNYLLLQYPNVVSRNNRDSVAHFEDKMFLNLRLKNNVTHNAVLILFRGEIFFLI